MNKISLVRKRKNAYVDIKIESGQSLNNREYELLRSRKSDYLLCAEAGKKSIRYNISEYISLAEYFKSVTSKERFLTAISYILEGLRESQSLQLLELKRFVLDKDYIFVSRQDKRICFIYFPIINEDNGYDVKEFLNSMAFNTIFNQMEDCSYVSQYIQYFRQHLDFSLYDFENFINSLKNGKKNSSGKLGEPEHNENNFQSTSNAVYTPDFNGRVAHPSKLLSNDNKKVKYCPNCKKILKERDQFCCYCGQPVDTQKNLSKGKPAGTSVLGVQNDIDGTMVLSEEQLAIKIPCIIRTATGECIEITKPDFIIGQITGNADYCVVENTAVSREHAHIMCKEGIYYIIDYKSTNGTFVDNQKLKKNMPVQIENGTFFRLANEEFRFEIREK